MDIIFLYLLRLDEAAAMTFEILLFQFQWMYYDFLALNIFVIQCLFFFWTNLGDKKTHNKDYI